MMEKTIGGTLVWYYCVCHRQVWLLAHGILPDEADKNIQIGRIIDQWAYPRKRQRQINLDGVIVIDLLADEGVVAEVKKSSATIDAARLQLAYYLYYLKTTRGVIARGVVLVPEERRRYDVELTPELETRVKQVLEEIEAIRSQGKPPPPQLKRHCKPCAYSGVCWG